MVAGDHSTLKLVPDEDNSKRRQILDGARKVFMDLGFDGASMGGIARSAGVSKGTLYVYFADKCRLFEAIVEDELEDRPYLAGSELTLAEIVLGTMVYRWHAFPIERPKLKNLKAWYERMRERPGFRAHIEIPIT